MAARARTSSPLRRARSPGIAPPPRTGWTGTDHLAATAAADSLEFDAVATNVLAGGQRDDQLDLTDGAPNRLFRGLDDVLAITDDADTLFVEATMPPRPAAARTRPS